MNSIRPRPAATPVIAEQKGGCQDARFESGEKMSAITRRGFVKGAALAPLALRSFALEQQTSKADRFDVVVAGAGHNSLVAAAYLAKAGYRCLILEGRPSVGGDVKTGELTLPGFKHDTCSSGHIIIQDNPLLRNDELRLGDYGLEYIF